MSREKDFPEEYCKVNYFPQTAKQIQKDKEEDSENNLHTFLEFCDEEIEST